MTAAEIAERLRTAAPEAVITPAASADQPTLDLPEAWLVRVALAARDDPSLKFELLADLTAVDWWPREPRFQVVYHLASIERRERLRLRVSLPGDRPEIPTLQTVWPAAGWLEREVWDLFGIVFGGHGDLRRILMPDDWEGHPLRKDYPVQIDLPPKVWEPLEISEAQFREARAPDRSTGGPAEAGD